MMIIWMGGLLCYRPPVAPVLPLCHRLHLALTKEASLVCLAVSLAAVDQVTAKQGLGAVPDFKPGFPPPAPGLDLFDDPGGLLCRLDPFRVDRLRLCGDPRP